MVHKADFARVIWKLADWWVHWTVIKRLSPESRVKKRRIAQRIWELKSSVSDIVAMNWKYELSDEKIDILESAIVSEQQTECFERSDWYLEVLAELQDKNVCVSVWEGVELIVSWWVDISWLEGEVLDLEVPAKPMYAIVTHHAHPWRSAQIPIEVLEEMLRRDREERKTINGDYTDVSED